MAASGPKGPQLTGLPHFIDWSQRPSRELAPGVMLQLAGTEHMMLSYVTLQPGSTVPLHKHPHEQVGIMVSGRGEFTIGGETRHVKAGDCYQIPGGVEHALTVSELTVALDIFCPPREDYLQGLE